MLNDNKTNKRSIVYLDTFNSGASHEMFNASLLLMCSEVADHVTCRCSKSNFKAIEDVLNKSLDNVTFKSVFVISGESKFSILSRYIFAAITILYYLLRSSSTCDIIIPYNNVFALNQVNRFNKILNRKIIIFCHNEMEALASDANVKGKLSKLLYKRCRNFFKDSKIDKNILFSVMGDKILLNLSKIVSMDKIKHFVSIDHPYIFNELQFQKKVLTNNLIRIGTIGTLCEARGGDSFIRLASIMPNKVKEIIQLSHIGRIMYPLDIIVKAQITVFTATNFLSREMYNRKIQELDYILFFYDKSNYKVTASGAIMDAIAMGIPIISLKNDYFEYVFDKFGSFGFLMESVDEMINLFQDISLNNLSNSFDLESIRNEMTPEAISTQLMNALNSLELNY